MSTPELGDLVQWYVNGQDQFPEPRAIARFADIDGQRFCFVADSATGIPVDQVAKVLIPLSSLPPDPRAAVLALHDRGFWVVLVEGKSPKIMGLGWGLNRKTKPELQTVLRRHRNAGPGICVGPDRAPDGSWLIDLEGDGPQAEESRLRLFGGESVETFSWSSTRGGHSLFTCEGEQLLDLLAAAGAVEGNGHRVGTYKLDALPGLEIRIGGHKPDGTVKQIQSVAPPTPGDDDEPRKWNGVNEIAPLPDAAYAFIENLAERLGIQSLEPPTASPRTAQPKSEPWGGLSSVTRPRP
jgi:hypothetical protein